MEKEDLQALSFEGLARRLREAGRLLEQVEGKRGLEWEVVLIEAGLSRNGNLYPEEALRGSAPLFEGVKAFLDHAGDLRLRPERSVREIVGWFEGVRFEPPRLLGRFKLSPAEERLRLLMVDAWERGKRDLIGFSIDALARSRERFTEEGVVHEVEKILKVFSVDVVTDPAAGGAVLRLVASQAPRPLGPKEKERLGMKEGHLGTISPTAPPLPAGVEREGLGEKDPREEASAGLQAERRLLEETRRAACQALLEGQIESSHLPLPMREAIRREFEGRVFEADHLRRRIKEARQMWAALEKSGEVQGLGGRIEVGEDERERLGKAMDGFFAGQDIDHVPRFRSFREAYQRVTGRVLPSAYDILHESYPAKYAESRRLRESLQTTSWAEILGDSISRRMLAEYRLPVLNAWQKIVSDLTSVSDFRTQRRMRMGGYGTLPAVSEKGTYQALTSPGDEEVTYAVTKRGGTEDLTLEMVANDNVGAIRRIPVKLGRAAAITLYRFVFDFLVNNPALDYDATALFHANHGNLGSSALSSATLDTARQSMRSQAAFGASTEILGVVPRFLLVPNELEHLAWRLSRSLAFLGVSGENATTPNLHQGIEVIVVDYWTDANDWVVVADPNLIPTMEIGFFEGREEPELFVQDIPNVGSMFDSDTITYKIRHIYGGDVLDHRGFFKAVVA